MPDPSNQPTTTEALSPILATKLYLPPPRLNAVHRQRLIERLNEGLHRKLTLVSAPAGFGKTTLISEWLAACEQLAPGLRVAWLSLDESDSDLSRFLTYLVAALQTSAPNIGAGLLPLLHAQQNPPTESVLTSLLNEIAHLAERFVLILDDYHLVDAKAVDDALAFLVEHQPPQFHLVITTREDPNLPLARLRARGQLTEVRARDLRFNASEAADFLNQGMSLRLSAEDIAALEDRTEGWIAGLQLAALSLQGHQDIPGFIRSFAGDHRYIVDYLVEEVLQRQPKSIRQFLLQTAILDRFNASLCDAVTGQQDGGAQLEALERGNFLIVPLDEKRHWYRYHHLFAGLLTAHLLAEYPDQVAALHHRASDWYEQNELPAEAIHHAMLAQDFQRAATLIERAVPQMRRSRQELTLLAWLQALPDEVFRFRPVLSVHYAGTLLQNGILDGVEARLADAERWLGTGERPDALSRSMIVVDEEEFRRLPAVVAMYHSAMALVLGNVADSVKYARQILELSSDEDHLLHGAAESLLGLSFWTNGDLEAGQRCYTDGVIRLRKAGYISDAIGCTIALADIRLAQGRLRGAMNTYERGLQLATQGSVVLRGAADMLVGMSRLHCEWNDLDAAMHCLQRSGELGDFAGLPQNRYRWRVAMARIRELQGDVDGALDLFAEAEHLFTSDFSPNVQPIPALKARLWVAQNRLGDALNWADEQGLTSEDNLSYLREFEHITLSRVLLAQYRNDRAGQSALEAIEFLSRLLQTTEAGGRLGSTMEILVLQAIAHHMLGDRAAALMPLERALTLAEPEHYVRLFVDEGPPMADLLEEAAQRRVAPTYVRQLLAAFGKGEQKTRVTQELIEPLSERELDVLRLLGTDMSGPEIAHKLIVSLSTLRTHTQNIYTKLGVNNRRAAVRRAEELHLI